VNGVHPWTGMHSSTCIAGTVCVESSGIVISAPVDSGEFSDEVIVLLPRRRVGSAGSEIPYSELEVGDCQVRVYSGRGSSQVRMKTDEGRGQRFGQRLAWAGVATDWIQ